MARKTVIQLVDDLDNTPIAEGEGRTVSLTIDGVSYEIDLSDEHVDELNIALSPYLSAARKTGARSSSSSKSAPAKTSPKDLQKIREWANANGHSVSSRGRISASIRDAYDAAH